MQPSDFVADEKKTAVDYIDSLEPSGLAKRTDDNYYRFRFVPVLRYLFKFVKVQRRFKALQAKRRKLSQAQRKIPIEIPIEVEVEAFSRVREVTKSKKSRYVGKIAVLLVSLLLFILAFKITFSISIILLLVIVLFIHELGHILGMRLFKYKDLQVIFIPFLGAAALGGHREATALQKVVVYLLGPALGIVIGTLSLLLGITYDIRLLMVFGAFSLILNYLNLVPLIPLDGGRVFELILFSRVSFLKSAFLIGSVGVMAVVGIGLNAPVLVGLSVFLGLGTWPQILQNRALSQLRKRIKAENLEIADENIIQTIFRMLREKPFTKLPFARKYAIATHLSDNVMQKLPTVWTSVLSLVIYVAVLLLPITMLFNGVVLVALWQLFTKGHIGA
jgi:Zn-dependent protease